MRPSWSVPPQSLSPFLSRLFLSCLVLGFLMLGCGGESDVSRPADLAPGDGLVIERIGPESISARAGLEPGDLLLAWSHSAGSPAQDDAPQPLTLVHQLRWLEIEKAPRGDVVLHYRRGEDRREARLSVGDWKITARPALPRQALDLYLAARERQEAETPSEAHDLYLEAAESIVEDDARAAAFLFERAALAAKAAKDWEAAKDAVAHAIDVAAREERPGWVATLRLAETEIHKRLGHLDEAEVAISAAIDRLEGRSDLRLIRALALQERGVLRFRSGRLDEAAADMKEALAIRREEAAAGLWVSRSLGALATFPLTQGRIREAREQIEAALAVEESFDPGSITAGSYLSNLANIALYEGRIKQADAYLDRYAEILESRGEEQLARRASVANNRALLRAAMGDLDGAEDLLGRAIELKTTLGTEDTLEVAMSLTNLANLQLLRDRLAEAEATGGRAFEILQRIAPAGVPLAAVLGTLGNAARERRDFERAESLYGRALSILREQNPGSLRVARIYSNQAAMALAVDDPQRAETLARQALTIIDRLAPASEEAIATRRLLGKILRRAGRLDEASKAYRLSLESLDHLARHVGQSDIRQIFFWKKASTYYAEAVELAAERGRAVEAYEIFERSRARSMLRLLAERKIATVPPEIEAKLRAVGRKYEEEQAKLAELSVASDASELEALRTDLRSLRREQERLWEQAARHRGRHRGRLQQATTAQTARSVQAVLDDGTLLLAYSVGEDRTVLLTLTSTGGPSVEILEPGEADLRQAVDAFRDDLRDARGTSGAGGIRLQRAQRRGEALYKQLLRPVQPQLDSAERLLIAPDAALHDLPFAALVTGREPHAEYLIESRPVGLVLSGSVLASLRQDPQGAEAPSRPPAEASTQAHLVAFGDPSYPEAETSVEGGAAGWERLGPGGGLTPLPGSRTEVERIVSLFPEAEAYLGPDASEEKLQEVEEVSHLHLACHGIADSRSPLDSLIALSSPGARSGSAENGLLFAWEVLQKIRLDASLVVLSACSSASGADMGGEGLVGISWAFQGAGARSVVAPLWTIRDDLTPAFMETFYRALLGGKTKDEALRHAQLALLGGGDDGAPRRAPYDWAAFQLYGDFR